MSCKELIRAYMESYGVGMYNIKVDYIEFIGCEDDCWKFLYGFLGLSHRDYAYSGLLDVDGAYSSYGTVVITEVE